EQDARLRIYLTHGAQALTVPLRCHSAKPRGIHTMRREEEPIVRIAVMRIVGTGSLADVEGGVEEPQKPRIDQSLDRVFEPGPRCLKLAVRSHHDRNGEALGCKRTLKVGLQMPAHH